MDIFASEMYSSTILKLYKALRLKVDPPSHVCDAVTLIFLVKLGNLSQEDFAHIPASVPEVNGFAFAHDLC